MKIFFEGSKRSAVSRMFPVIESMGHKIVSDYRFSDIQLSVVFIQNKTRPTVLRLDNIYYDIEDGYKKRNLIISKSHQIAEGVIYQSFTSKNLCEKHLEKRKTSIYDVVYNGVSEYEFNSEHIYDSNIHIVSSAKWRRVKRLPEIIRIFNSFHQKYPNSYLHILGSMLKGAEKINGKNIIYYDYVKHNTMKEIYRKMDVFLFLAKNDSCPSAVIEAISAGIPIVTSIACGGATEMCRFTENCFICEPEYTSLEADYIYREPWNFLNKDLEDNIIKAIEKVIKNKLRTSLPDELKIETTAKKYVKVMERVLNET